MGLINHTPKPVALNRTLTITLKRSRGGFQGAVFSRCGFRGCSEKIKCGFKKPQHRYKTTCSFLKYLIDSTPPIFRFLNFKEFKDGQKWYTDKNNLETFSEYKSTQNTYQKNVRQLVQDSMAACYWGSPGFKSWQGQ